MSDGSTFLYRKMFLYDKMLRRLLDRGLLHRDTSILVLAAGETDREVFLDLGFTNVTLSNLERNLDSESFLPYHTLSLDAEDIDCLDGEFEFVVIHSGLHHCASPHRAILEMYRVARLGIVAFEPKDSWFVRMMRRLKFGQEYEIASTVGKESSHGGGLRHGGIPNYVYRFTHDEFVKCIETYSPYARHHYVFLDNLRVPISQYRMKRNPVLRVIATLATPFVVIMQRIPALANNMAVAILKPRLPQELHPWLEVDGTEIVLNSDWVEARCR